MLSETLSKTLKSEKFWEKDGQPKRGLRPDRDAKVSMTRPRWTSEKVQLKFADLDWMATWGAGPVAVRVVRGARHVYTTEDGWPVVAGRSQPNDLS